MCLKISSLAGTAGGRHDFFFFFFSQPAQAYEVSYLEVNLLKFPRNLRKPDLWVGD